MNDDDVMDNRHKPFSDSRCCSGNIMPRILYRSSWSSCLQKLLFKLENEDDILGGKPASKGAKEAKPNLGMRTLLPVVEFLQPGGARRTVVVSPDTWKVELPSGEVQVSRVQVRNVRSADVPRSIDILS